MTLTTRVLIGLVAGLAGGLLLAGAPPAITAAVLAVAEPVGAIFINAIRMTVIPLVAASLIVGVASAPDAGTIGRLGGRALVYFLVVLAAAGIVTALVAPPLLALLPLDARATAALRASAAATAGGTTEAVRHLPTTAQWLVELVPANPVEAAAKGAMLPLIVFAVAFGVALTRVAAEWRASVVSFFRGVSEAMLVLVRWILALAPVGVFALAIPLAARLGLAAAGALASYVAIVSGLSLLFIALLYVPAVTLGRVRLVDFARAAAPAQAVAFSSRSSLAALPAMIEEARDRLHARDDVTGFLLPLAAAVFRAGGAIGITGGVLFIARLYGVELGATQLASVVVTAVLTTFSVPGVPGGSILVMVPALVAANVPVAGIGLLLGIDTIPDMFRTTANVTGSMSAAVVVGGKREERER